MNFLTILILILSTLILILDVWMIISAATNNKLTTNQKLLWILGMLLLHPIIAIFYYFMVFKKT